MKNIITVAIAGLVLWNATLALSDFVLKNHKELARVSAEMRGMPLAVHARAVETDNVIDWAANKH